MTQVLISTFLKSTEYLMKVSYKQVVVVMICQIDRQINQIVSFSAEVRRIYRCIISRKQQILKVMSLLYRLNIFKARQELKKVQHPVM